MLLDERGGHLVGRVVMRNEIGWVVDVGGPHGTPAVMDETNFVAFAFQRSKPIKGRR